MSLGLDSSVTPGTLEASLRGATAVDLLGVNRGAATEIEDAKEAFAERLVEACSSADKGPQMLDPSSIRWDRDTPCVRSKRRAAQILRMGKHYVDMSTLTTHDITKVRQGTLGTLYWPASFDPAAPCTVPELI